MANKNERSYSFLAVLLVTFLSVQKSDNEEKFFLVWPARDHIVFQMLTA